MTAGDAEWKSRVFAKDALSNDQHASAVAGGAYGSGGLRIKRQSVASNRAERWLWTVVRMKNTEAIFPSRWVV